MNFLSGLLGALIGGGVTLFASGFAAKNARVERRNAAVKEVTSEFVELARTAVENPAQDGKSFTAPVVVQLTRTQIAVSGLAIYAGKKDGNIIDWCTTMIMETISAVGTADKYATSGIVGVTLAEWTAGRRNRDWFAKALKVMDARS